MSIITAMMNIRRITHEANMEDVHAPEVVLLFTCEEAQSRFVHQILCDIQPGILPANFNGSRLQIAGMNLTMGVR